MPGKTERYKLTTAADWLPIETFAFQPGGIGFAGLFKLALLTDGEKRRLRGGYARVELFGSARVPIGPWLRINRAKTRAEKALA